MGSSSRDIMAQMPEKKMVEIKPDEGKEAREFILVKKLEGRGQAGEAGFYRRIDAKEVKKEENKEAKNELFLIKEDDAETCIQEGTGVFAKHYLPQNYESVVNFAECRAFECQEGNQRKTIIATIQPAVNGYPLDKALLGDKRHPKQPVSAEWSHQSEISSYIAGFSKKVKAELAAAIFASALVGDESLHIGQFMVLCNEEDRPKSGAPNQRIPPDKVTGIVRIDWGARERYGEERYDSKDFEHKTSDRYAGSGQWGKDYMSYLLSDPEVKSFYLKLWVRVGGISVKDASNDEQLEIDDLDVECIRSALRQIPEEKKPETLKRVLEIYMKGNEKIQQFKNKTIKEEDVFREAQKIIDTRTQAMTIKAGNEIKKQIETCQFGNKSFININKEVEEQKKKEENLKEKEEKLKIIEEELKGKEEEINALQKKLEQGQELKLETSITGVPREIDKEKPQQTKKIENKETELKVQKLKPRTVKERELKEKQEELDEKEAELKEKEKTVKEKEQKLKEKEKELREKAENKPKEQELKKENPKPTPTEDKSNKQKGNQRSLRDIIKEFLSSPLVRTEEKDYEYFHNKYLIYIPDILSEIEVQLENSNDINKVEQYEKILYLMEASIEYSFFRNEEIENLISIRSLLNRVDFLKTLQKNGIAVIKLPEKSWFSSNESYIEELSKIKRNTLQMGLDAFGFDESKDVIKLPAKQNEIFKKCIEQYRKKRDEIDVEFKKNCARREEEINFIIKKCHLENKNFIAKKDSSAPLKESKEIKASKILTEFLCTNLQTLGEKDYALFRDSYLPYIPQILTHIEGQIIYNDRNAIDQYEKLLCFIRDRIEFSFLRERQTDPLIVIKSLLNRISFLKELQKNGIEVINLPKDSPSNQSYNSTLRGIKTVALHNGLRAFSTGEKLTSWEIGKVNYQELSPTQRKAFRTCLKKYQTKRDRVDVEVAEAISPKPPIFIPSIRKEEPSPPSSSSPSIAPKQG